MFAFDFLGDTVFASHLGVETMRTIDENGRSGLAALSDALDDHDGPLEPDTTWTTRKAMDTKVDFIIDGLRHDWPEI